MILTSLVASINPPPKKGKRAGVLFIGSTIKPPDSPDNFSKPIVLPATNISGKVSVQVKELVEFLKSRERGDVLDNAFAKFLAWPSLKFAVPRLKSSANVAHALALITGETELVPPANNNFPLGPFQMGRKAIAEAIDTYIDEFKTMPVGNIYDYTTAAHGAAMYGHFKNLTRFITRHWSFGPTGWRPDKTIALKPAVLQLLKTYGPVLHHRDQGFQILLTLYHINGPRAHAKPVPLPHGYRFEQDARAFAGYLPLIQKSDLRTMMGDPISPMVFGSTYFINAAVASSVRWKQAVPMADGTALITHPFGERRKRGRRSVTHKGLDIRARTPIPIFSPGDGTVTFTTDTPRNGFGKYIVLRFVDGTMMRFAHLSKVYTKAGFQVIKGQWIGISGDSDAKGQPHLHLEWFGPSTSVNPFSNQLDPRSDPDQRWRYTVNSI